MAAIGGIFNTDGHGCDTEALARMSKALCRRGGERREAAVFDGCGLFWAARGNEGAMARLSDLVILCDGDVYTEWEGEGAEFFGENSAELCAEVLGRYRGDMTEHLFGEYAVAAYDKTKKELLLFGDRQGRRPLYYSRVGNSIGFASEIKGVLAFLGSPVRAERARIYAHVLSREGQYRGVELYSDINEVGTGSVLCASEGKISSFKYNGEEPTSEAVVSRLIGGDLACPDEEGMSRLLREVLYAFDYPQFDCLMPSFLRDAHRAELGGGVVADGTLCTDIAYSLERRDRLSTLLGYRPPCAPPRTGVVRERELKKMERVLKGIFLELDRDKLRLIFGRDIEEEIGREGNTARRIRYIGMAIQTEAWLDGYGVYIE